MYTSMKIKKNTSLLPVFKFKRLVFDQAEEYMDRPINTVAV